MNSWGGQPVTYIQPFQFSSDLAKKKILEGISKRYGVFFIKKKLKNAKNSSSPYHPTTHTHTHTTKVSHTALTYILLSFFNKGNNSCGGV